MNTDRAVPAVVTGSGGFVGSALVARLGEGAQGLALSGDNWRERIGGISWRDKVVFHLAARVHGAGRADEALHERDNHEKTRELGEAAARGGARRLVFLSTIKVNGEETAGDAFTSADSPDPRDAYARSKWRAEQALAECARSSGLEVAIVRSPLVVGPGALGNLRALLRLVDTPWPLPLAGIANRRSLLSLPDLVELLRLAAVHPGAVGGTLLASGGSLSTPAIVTALRRALGRAPRLFALPAPMLEALGGERMLRLTRSLEVDAAETTRRLGWNALTPPEDALADMARAASR